MDYAHSLPGRPNHLKAVSIRAKEFGSAFGWVEAAAVAGLLHDIGKASMQFQAYIRAAPAAPGAEQVRGGDHSTAGARVAVERYGPFGRLIAFGIAGHHAGLADGDDLDRRLDALPADQGWERHTGPLPALRDLTPTGWCNLEAHKGCKAYRGYSQAFLTRMLFSCLVDADFLETERFYAEAGHTTGTRGGHASVGLLLDRLRLTQAGQVVASTSLNQLRAEVLDHALAGLNSTLSSNPHQSSGHWIGCGSKHVEALEETAWGLA